MICVGLDPDRRLMPINDVFEFNKEIIDATHDVVTAYKLQLAFYEALGLYGIKALERTIAHIRSVAPNTMVIGDGKRSGTGKTAQANAKAMFMAWGFDATTVYLYEGTDVLMPFLEYNKRVFVCSKTSNPSSTEIQDITDSKISVSDKVAQLAVEMGENVGLVVGATFLNDLSRLRAAYPTTLFLIPGIGAQYGDVKEVVRRSVSNTLINSSRKITNTLINSSRNIIYASREKHNFALRAREAVCFLEREINYSLPRIVE